MNLSDIPDPLFRDAVAALDAGDVDGLARLLRAHPRLVRERASCGEGYFQRPYLLWFVAENPVRNDTLSPNIAEVTRVLLGTLTRERVESMREQVDRALSLVASGRVPRERGVQRELIDVLVDAGADPTSALLPALANRETDAAERLLERGAALTLTAAISLHRDDDARQLVRSADEGELATALAAAALYGRADSLTMLIGAGARLNSFSPAGFHAHATALHHAVDSGSLDAVKVLIAAGARRDVEDRVYRGTPLDWAEHLHRVEIAAALRAASA